MRVVLALLALCAAAPLDAQSGRIWRSEDRALVTWSGDLTAVALGTRLVYALSPFGVIAYDRVARQWVPPITMASGFPAQERPSALAYDRARDGLWLGTEAGGIYELSAFADRWQPVTRVNGGITRLVPVLMESALYVETRSGWLVLDGVSARPAGAPPAEAAQDPLTDRTLAPALGSLALDPFGRRWRLTAAARGDHPGDYWIATGGGLVRFEAARMQGDWLFTGLPSVGAGAVARIGNALWIGSDRARPIGGVAVTDSILAQWVRHDADVARAPRGFVREFAGSNERVWAASQDGLFRFADARWTRIEEVGLDRTTTVAVAGANVWVGTMRGLVRLDDLGTVREQLLPSVRIQRVHVVRDTLWIAAQDGLYAVPAASSSAAHTPGAFQDPIARGLIIDVAVADDALYALTETGLRRYANGAWSGPVGDARIGRAHRLALAPGALWVAGDAGAARLDLATGAWLTFVAPVDITAGPVMDVLPWGDDVWLATPAGAVRLRWRD